MFLDQDNYMLQKLSRNAGAKIVVHDSALPPLTDENGIDLQQTTATSIALQTVKKKLYKKDNDHSMFQYCIVYCQSSFIATKLGKLHRLNSYACWVIALAMKIFLLSILALPLLSKLSIMLCKKASIAQDGAFCNQPNYR